MVQGAILKTLFSFIILTNIARGSDLEETRSRCNQILQLAFQIESLAQGVLRELDRLSVQGSSSFSNGAKLIPGIKGEDETYKQWIQRELILRGLNIDQLVKIMIETHDSFGVGYGAQLKEVHAGRIENPRQPLVNRLTSFFGRQPVPNVWLYPVKDEFLSRDLSVLNGYFFLKPGDNLAWSKVVEINLRNEGFNTFADIAERFEGFETIAMAELTTEAVQQIRLVFEKYSK